MHFPRNIANIIGSRSFNANTVGMSDSAVYTFDDMVLKIEKNSSESEQNIAMTKWLHGKLPVPKLICCTTENGINYMLMSKAAGEMSCAEKYMLRPELLTDILAESLKLLWSVDVSDCPCSNSIDRRLELAEYRVKNGLVDMDEFSPETLGANSINTPQKLLEWLKSNRPHEEFVLSHGDFCLPNLFIDNDRLSCFIDLGRCGKGDKWNDIAICCRSLKWNFDGFYGGKVYSGYSEESFFKKLGIAPDYDKIMYYQLLDELF